MLARIELNRIVANEALTRGLADPEARILVEWLVEQAERIAQDQDATDAIRLSIDKLCLRGRAIGRFVGLWCHAGEQGAAIQLAAAERFTWPLPTSSEADPFEIMHSILACESGLLCNDAA